MTDQWGEMTNSGGGEMTMGRDDLIPNSSVGYFHCFGCSACWELI